MEAKIVRIGNSKGIRLPRRILARYGFEDKVTLRELDNGLLIEKEDSEKLSWAETYRAISENDEDWSDWAELDLEEME